jgi:hypothetical protein
MGRRHAKYEVGLNTLLDRYTCPLFLSESVFYTSTDETELSIPSLDSPWRAASDSVAFRARKTTFDDNISPLLTSTRDEIVWWKRVMKRNSGAHQDIPFDRADDALSYGMHSFHRFCIETPKTRYHGEIRTWFPLRRTQPWQITSDALQKCIQWKPARWAIRNLEVHLW